MQFIKPLANFITKLSHSRRFVFFIKVSTFIFTFFAIWRIIFLVSFFPKETLLSDIGYAFYLGLKFDMRLAMLCFVPIIFMSVFPYLNLATNFVFRLLSRAYLTILLILLSVFYGLDLGHYDYLTRRIDVTILNFLTNPDISGEMLWQSYPVVWFFLGYLLISVFIFFVVRYLHQGLKKPKITFSIPQKISGMILGAIFLLFGLWQSLSQFPLRWSEAFFSQHHFVNALALNPVLYFADTYAFLDKEYDISQTKKYYNLVSHYLNDQQSLSGPLSYLRQVKSDSTNTQTPNIVLVLLETVPASRFSILGNPVNATPYLNKLSQDGVLFENFYVNLYGTARSVFTVLTGIPDVSRSDTSSRNPLIVKQNSILSSFHDHEKFYMIGGSANWANIRGFIRHNITDINMYEQPQFKGSKIDVWGISDYDLLLESHDIFKKRKSKKPFFAFIQTAANHSPYTIPKNIKGFKIDKSLDPELLKKAGYRSPEQYNSIRFLDYSIQAFMEKAMASDYGKNTIFCFFGDHGTSSYILDHMPFEQSLGLTSFHVPLIIYGPKYLKQKGLVKGFGSLPDVMPTLAGLAGIGYENKTFGKDLFSQTEEQRNKNHVICVSFEAAKSKILLLGKDFVLSMYSDLSNQKLFKFKGNDLNNVKDQFPNELESNTKLAKGLYETAKYMLHHPE